MKKFTDHFWTLILSWFMAGIRVISFPAVYKYFVETGLLAYKAKGREHLLPAFFNDAVRIGGGDLR
jgi:hypothetical protein